MSDVQSPWFMATLVMALFALGGVVFGRFEQHRSPARRVTKQLLVLAVFMVVETAWGRLASLALLGAAAVFFVVVHAWWLPRNGVHGVTAEPSQRYLELMGVRPVGKTFPVAQFRAARPVRSLEKVRQFYGDGLGLPVVGAFTDHEGFSGVMFGLPDSRAHLEFTEGPHPPTGTPHPEENFVFYVPDDASAEAVVQRLAARGYPAVTPANPFWARGGTTVADPDGFRVVVMRSSGLD